MVIQMIRTEKIPFIQSRPSLKSGLMCAGGIAAATIIPFTSFAPALGFSVLPGFYFIGLGLIIVGYLTLAEQVKKGYPKNTANCCKTDTEKQKTEFTAAGKPAVFSCQKYGQKYNRTEKPVPMQPL